MFIIFHKQTKKILLHGEGNPVTVDNKYFVNNEAICNDATNYDWKYINQQILPRDEFCNYRIDADDLPAVEKPVSIEELKEQLAATNAILLDMYLGV